MNRHLEAKLRDDSPSLFRDLYGDPRQTCMAFGVQCEDGWEPIIRNLCERLKPLVDDDFRFAQIKEKFGTLRVYFDGPASEDALRAIEVAEEQSRETCEVCGRHGEGVELSQSFWLVKTLCPPCRA